MAQPVTLFGIAATAAVSAVCVSVCVVVAVAGGSGCGRSQPPSPGPADTAKQAATAAPTFTPIRAPLKESRTAPAKVVAIGDLHGDLDATKRVLRLAGAIDAKDAWIGGKLMVVQTGDEIDRGDDDRAILELFERLKGDATKTGGEVVAMAGNHEIMNAMFDFRYVTPRAFTPFADVKPKSPEVAAALLSLDADARGRAAAFAPGGPYAAMIARRPVVFRVGESIFVHGGVLPKHVTFGLDRINEEARAWLLGEQSTAPKMLTSEDGPLWTRMYSAAPGREECAMLSETLTMLAAKRLVMGHTVQRNGINPACDGKGWRIDAGMSKFYSGSIQALAIEGDVVTVLKEQ